MTPRVFFDTNVVLDMLLARRPFFEPAQRLWAMAEAGRFEAVISASSVLNTHYIVRKLASRPAADRAIHVMQALFDIEPVDAAILQQAFDLKPPDFEDAVQYCCARRAKAGVILSRDAAHFRDSDIPVFAPGEFLAKIDRP